jgi:hydroxymethylpyrimidine pyrophosphatase-like HAD family hydrolase
MSNIPAIIVDLDGTLCDHTVRHQRALDKGYDQVSPWAAQHFEDYYRGLENDPPIRPILNIVKRFKHDHKIIFITGRPIQYFEETMIWLANHGFFISKFKLFMRQEINGIHDTEMKKMIYQNQIKEKYDVRFVLEDRNSVVKMWRDLGLTCLQVQEGNF